MTYLFRRVSDIFPVRPSPPILSREWPTFGELTFISCQSVAVFGESILFLHFVHEPKSHTSGVKSSISGEPV